MEDIITNVLKDHRLDEYPLFKSFCVFKYRGLRKEAFKVLSTFIVEAKEWDTDKKQNFSCWLFSLFEISDNIHHLLVHPLEENLLNPILKDWIKNNPKDPRPYRWYGLFLQTENPVEYLKQAISLGGKSEQLSLLKLISRYFDSLWYSFHHISEDLYLGDTQEDSNLIAELQQLNEMVESEQFKKNIDKEISYYKELLHDWMLFQKVQNKDFVHWCRSKGKDYHFSNAYYYEK